MRLNFPRTKGPGRAGIAMTLAELDDHFGQKPGTCFGTLVNPGNATDLPKSHGVNAESGKKLYRVGEFRRHLQLRGKLQ